MLQLEKRVMCTVGNNILLLSPLVSRINSPAQLAFHRYNSCGNRCRILGELVSQLSDLGPGTFGGIYSVSIETEVKILSGDIIAIIW